MKKIVAFLCVLTCLLGLVGCGNNEEYSDLQNQKIGQCESLAQCVMQVVELYGDQETLDNLKNNYNKLEIEAIFEQVMVSGFQTQLDVEKGVFEGLLTNYIQTVSEMGGLVSVGDATHKVIGNEIIITIPLIGNDCTGQMILTFSNDVFSKLKEGEVTSNTSIKQKLHEAGKHMGNAGLNTLLGMGTVFFMLIFISLIISSFTLFNGSKRRPADKKVETPAENKQVNTTEVTEAEEEELADDTELVAVIMAAIKAYEGNASTDGFVVRSIRRANRRN